MMTLAVVEVGEMETIEATELFWKCAKLQSPRPDVNTEVLLIVTELGKLALAITLDGSYVAATPRLKMNIRLYLPEYHERRKQLLGTKANKQIHRYGESVLSTWETSFTAIERQSAMAARLLSLLAFLNFNDIFPALFKRPTGEEKLAAAVSKAPDRQWQSYFSPDGPADQYAVEAAFRVLQTYSLVQWRDDRGGYAMHKLVHAWGQDRLEVEQQQHLSLMALKLLIDIIPSASGNSTFGTRLVPHLMTNFAIISNINTAPAIDDESLNSVAVVGNFLNGLGRWLDEYEIRAFHFGKLCERAGKEHPDTLGSMSNLAIVLRRLGKDEQAEEMLRQVLRVRETVLGKEHPDTLGGMSNLAMVLSGQGKYEQAEEMLRQVLGLMETVLGKEHPDTLTSMINLAEVLRRQGKDEQAEEMLRQVLGLMETVLGKEHPDTLGGMSNLAIVLSEQGKDEQAEEMLRQVLGLMETVLGKEHPSTLGSMINLANVLWKRGKYEQALRLREMVRSYAAPSHPPLIVPLYFTRTLELLSVNLALAQI